MPPCVQYDDLWPGGPRFARSGAGFALGTDSVLLADFAAQRRARRIADLGCGAGVCVTASHNPAKYNGYKVYGADGCQITLEAAEKILAAIEKIDCFDDVRLVDFDAAAAAVLY